MRVADAAAQAALKKTSLLAGHRRQRREPVSMRPTSRAPNARAGPIPGRFPSRVRCAACPQALQAIQTVLWPARVELALGLHLSLQARSASAVDRLSAGERSFDLVRCCCCFTASSSAAPVSVSSPSRVGHGLGSSCGTGPWSWRPPGGRSSGAARPCFPVRGAPV